MERRPGTLRGYGPRLDKVTSVLVILKERKRLKDLYSRIKPTKYGRLFADFC